MTTVAVLRGGPSSEYEVSMKTGAGVLNVLKDDPVELRDIVITKRGAWMVNGFERTPEQALADVDVAFVAMHGEFGEDGQVQRILERYGVPYTGSRPYPSSVAMNKQLTKQQLKELGIKFPQHMRVSRGSDTATVASVIGDLFGPEYFIKPVSGGSSVHTYSATKQNLAEKVHEALEYHDSVLVEKRIRGKEATVGVLEQYRDQKHYVMPVIEIVPPAHRDFFDAEAKYDGSTEEIVPGRFSNEHRDELQKIAKDVHQALELRHYSRSDFMIGDDGIYFLEVNTLPGLTSESLFPKAIESVGGSYKELVIHLIDLARNAPVGRRR